MGYYSRVYGEIKFHPPATSSEIRAVKANWFKFNIETEVQEIPEGTLTKRSSSKIIVAYEESGKAYDIEDELAAYVDALPGRKFTGEFRIEGEDSADISRLFVDANGKVTRWYAQLLWPDGSIEPRRT